MPNWLASELCMVASFSLGAWKTFKVLKHGGTDYNLLKTWCLLGLLRAFEEYFEFLVSWIPFYWLGKCLGLGLLYLPGGNIPTVVFERFVVSGMDNAHHVLNNFVVPNVVEFAVSLPWRVLLVLFPSMPPPPFSAGGGGEGSDSARRAAKRNGGGRGGSGPKRKGKGALSSQLQHLNTPTKTTSKADKQGGVSTAGRGGKKPRAAAARGGGSPQPPPLPARSPSQSPTSTSAAAASSKGGAADLVDQILRADNNGSRSDAGAQGAGAVSTPSRGEGEGAGANGEGAGTSPESGLSGGSSGGNRRPRRRRSFGEILRSAVTGSSKVRLRDHLFDLSTASPAPPLPDSGSRSRGDPPERSPPPLPSRSRSPPSSARAEPAVGSGSSSSSTRSSKPRLETAAAPRKASASTLPAVSGGYGSRDRRRGEKEKEQEEQEEEGDGPITTLSPPLRSNGLTRRRPSEFGSEGGGGGGGGGGGDEAGGGGSSDASSKTGRGRREAGSGAGARPGAGRRSMEKTSSFSSVSSNGRSSTGRSAASDKASFAARGGSTASTRSAGPRPAAGDASTAAAIADSRAQRLAEWRKKRAEKSRNEQAEMLRRTGHSTGSGSGMDDQTVAAAVAAAGEGWTGATTRGAVGVTGGEKGSIRSGVVTRASANARADTGASPPAKSRRSRHVERFRSDMARTAPGAAVPRGPQEDAAAGAAGAGSLRQKRGLVPATSSSRSSRG